MSQLPEFSQASPYPQAGEVLDGKYRVEKLLGEGGMGAVAKATHVLRRAPVALKFMSPAVLALQGAVERFVNEGVAASQIDSDHVVKVFDVGRMPTGAPYLVMEFLDGADLQQILAREGGRLLDIPRAVHFTLQILRALQTAHQAGIIHRDMKPSNCFVINKDGEPDFVKLVDFGISKVRSDDPDGRSANLTRTNSALGTPLYMSPEQARSPRDVDHRTDLYSTGAILYEMLTGRTPYTADSGEYTEILFKIFTTDPEPLRAFRPDVPDALAAVVHRALVRDLGQRFGSASEMAEALTPYADGRSTALLSRLRASRGRSVVPAPPGGSGPAPGISITPANPAAGARDADVATANTFPGTPDMLKPAKIPTDIGVTKEATPSVASKPGKGGVVMAALALAVLVAGAGGVLVVRKNATVQPTAEPPPPVQTTATTAPTTPPPVVVSAAVPATSLTPLPSALPEPSASVAKGTATGHPPPTPGNGSSGGAAPNPGNKPPSTLGGIQLH